MKKETFLKLCDDYKKIIILCHKFNDGLGNLLNMPFEKYPSDSRSMLLWPCEAMDSVFKNIFINELNQTEESFDHFYDVFNIYANTDKFEAIISVNESEYHLNNLGDYFDFITKE